VDVSRGYVLESQKSHGSCRQLSVRKIRKQMEFNTTQTKLEIFLTSCNSFHVVSMLNILQHFNFYRAMLSGKMPCVCVCLSTPSVHHTVLNRLTIFSDFVHTVLVHHSSFSRITKLTTRNS